MVWAVVVIGTSERAQRQVCLNTCAHTCLNTCMRNTRALSPLGLAALKQPKMFEHVLTASSKVLWRFGAKVCMSVNLKEIDTIERDAFSDMDTSPETLQLHMCSIKIGARVIHKTRGTHALARTHARTRAHTRARTHVHARMCTHAHTHARMHMHTCTGVRPLVHTQTSACACPLALHAHCRCRSDR